MKHLTIKDIARELNLSVATVSRAFNDKYDIRKETRDLILQKAKELGYSPNPLAKHLLQQRTYNIGVVVPEFINAFFPEVIIGIQQVFFKKGYQVLIMQSSESSEAELENLKSLEKNMVEGLIISLSAETKNMDFIQHLIDQGIPVVLFNRINEALNVPKVVFDDYKWSLFATEHLIEHGYKKIYHLSGPKHLCLSRNRIRGYSRAMEKHQVPYDESYILETGFFLEDGERVTEELIRRNNLPEAIFATNDPTAIGAIKALRKGGYKVPDDVAVVGFTDSKMSEIIDPPLTSVYQPSYEMGSEAARLLLKYLESDEKIEAETIVMEGKLIIRKSSFRR